MKESKPLIGVYVLDNNIRKIREGNYDFRSYVRLKELAKAAYETRASLYFFSVKMVDLENETIKGLYWSAKHDKWEEGEFQFPDVLYDRRGKGGKKYRELARKIEATFTGKQIKRVNCTSYFNKWDVYRKLKKIPKVSHYIPITKLYKRDDDLISFLAIHSRVYLKGVLGGRGEKVIRVVVLPDKSYELSYMLDQIYKKRVKGMKELMTEVRKQFKDSKFIMQKEIELIRVGDSLVDFRAELQRNGKGELEIVGISGRIGQDKAPITIHSFAYPFQTFFTQYRILPEHEIDSLSSKAHQLLFDVYLTLEEVYGNFGEIGIDFAIDKAGDVWFIEPNAKSAKVSLQKAYDHETYHKSFLNPVKYAKYLYESSSLNPEGRED